MATNPEVYNIKEFLPHREPMLLVDIVSDISNNHVVTSYYIPKHSIFLNNGVFQETGVIENMAQTCSAIVGQSYFQHKTNQANKPKVIGFISEIKKAEYFYLPKVGQQIISKAELVSQFETEDYNLCKMNVTSFCESEKIAIAVLNLYLKKME